MTNPKQAFSTYAKYKDSGVDWLGEIPVEWEAMRWLFEKKLTPNKIA